MSSGSLVLVDQAAQGRFSADLADAEVPCDDAGRMVRAVGEALADALMRPGGVVVLLVFGQDGSQVRFAEGEAAVRELAPQGAGEALADRVHPRCLHSGAQDRGAGGLEDGVEGAGEVRSAVTDQEPEVLEPLAEVHRQVAGLLHRRSPVGWAVTPPGCIRRVSCSMNISTYSLFSSTVST